MKTALLALGVILFSCAHQQQQDSRLAEFSNLYRARVACEAAFAAFYIAKAKEILARVQEEDGTFLDFESAMSRYIALKDNIKTLVSAIDAQLALGLKHIEAGTPGDIFEPARELVIECGQIVEQLGLPLPTPEKEKKNDSRFGRDGIQTRWADDIGIHSSPKSG